MGFDASYQAVPVEWGLIERARQDKVVGEMLCSIPWWVRDKGKTQRSWPEAVTLMNELWSLAQKYPGLETRNCYLGRDWDALHYLLSATRRGESAFNDDSLCTIAVLGGAKISEDVRAPQGLPIKYVNPDEVGLISILLEPLTTESLRAHYLPARMEAAGVYKIWADRADDLYWTAISDAFLNLRNLYLNAARFGEGIIVRLD